MSSTQVIQKSIFYIIIQLLTLWIIFHQLTATMSSDITQTTGILILTAVLFVYAYKTIKLLAHFEVKTQNKEADLVL